MTEAFHFPALPLPPWNSNACSPNTFVGCKPTSHAAWHPRQKQCTSPSRRGTRPERRRTPPPWLSGTPSAAGYPEKARLCTACSQARTPLKNRPSVALRLAPSAPSPERLQRADAAAARRRSNTDSGEVRAREAARWCFLRRTDGGEPPDRAGNRERPRVNPPPAAPAAPAADPPLPPPPRRRRRLEAGASGGLDARQASPSHASRLARRRVRGRGREAEAGARPRDTWHSRKNPSAPGPPQPAHVADASRASPARRRARARGAEVARLCAPFRIGRGRRRRRAAAFSRRVPLSDPRRRARPGVGFPPILTPRSASVVSSLPRLLRAVHLLGERGLFADEPLSGAPRVFASPRQAPPPRPEDARRGGAASQKRRPPLRHGIVGRARGRRSRRGHTRAH